MTLLQSMEGKYYELPEDQASSFEVPREKVRELLTKAGPPPSAQGTPGPGHRPGPSGGPPPGAPAGGSPVIIQVLPNGIHGPAQAPTAPAAGGGDGEVDPYWWYYWWRNWSNYWY